MTDRYTKIVRTVIAVALTGNLAVQMIPKAEAQGRGCGMTRETPCYVAQAPGWR